MPPSRLSRSIEARRLRGHAQRIAHNDPTPRARVAKRRIRGIRDWEYGTLLGAIRELPGPDTWAGLDVGAGNSTFPDYDRSLLLDSADRSTYRGRHFTTFALLARKGRH
ncbi:MAG: hypothetical protein ACRDJY_03750 [Thermoleophilaceae bacterium]